MTATTPETLALARMVRTRCRRLVRDAMDLRRLAAQLEEAIADDHDTREDTNHDHEHAEAAELVR